MLTRWPRTVGIASRKGELVPDAESVGQFGETPEHALIKRSSHVSPPARCALTSTTSSCLWVPNSLGGMGAPLLRGSCVRHIAASNHWLQQLAAAAAIARAYPRGVVKRVAVSIRRFSCLTFILGHLGEGLPFMLHRINDQTSSLPGVAASDERQRST